MIARVLTDEQIDRLHEAALRILERTGFRLPHPEALRLLGDSGARIDPAQHRAWLPPEVVEGAVAAAGKRFAIYGRDPSRVAAFGEGTRNYNSIAGEAHWVDEPGAARRPCTLADVAAGARLGDALPWINVVGAMADPHDAAPSWRCVAVFAELLRNTTKPVTFWFHDRASARFLIEMMVALRGDEAEAARQPACYPFLEPISPLRFPFDGVDVLFETARLGLPVPIGPMAQMGVSAPATVAATLAQEHAEILAGVCIVQAIRPGTPVCYGGICHAFDMATTQMIFAGPEQAIFGVAMTQMGKRLGLPVYINVGLTDAKTPDAQAGLEAGVTLALGAAAGADIFGHLGISGVDQAASPHMLVLQEEVVAYVESALRQLDLSDEALALDAIDSAGPGGGHIGTEHTARHFRRELWFPRVLDRRYYDQWLTAGAPDAAERCRQRLEALRRDHAPEPVSEELDRELARIVNAAQRHGTDCG